MIMYSPNFIPEERYETIGVKNEFYHLHKRA